MRHKKFHSHTYTKTNKNNMNHRHLVHNFSPAWFAAVMGIGITGTLVYDFPYNALWLRVCGVIFYAVSIGLFAFSSILLITRLVTSPKHLSYILHHQGQCAFLGCIPMGLCTIINTTHSIWQDKAWLACYIMWWIDVLLALISAWCLVFIMVCYHDRSDIKAINSTILLPVVALVVASGTGSNITNSLPLDLQESTMVISLMLWGSGETLAFVFTTIYIFRLLSGNLPAKEIMISNFLPVGPLGQGAFAIMNMSAWTRLNDDSGPMGMGPGLSLKLGIFIALVMLGYASFWIFFAVCAVLANRPTKFNMSFWGLTFPIGTYVAACYQLGHHIPAFKVLGSIICVVLLLCVLGCSLGCIYWFNELIEQAYNETGKTKSDVQETDHRDSEEVTV